MSVYLTRSNADKLFPNKILTNIIISKRLRRLRIRREVIRLGFEFRMKIGFFETKTYDLSIRKGKLILSPRESDDGLITMQEENILSITLKKSQRSLEVEIQTDEKIYYGLLDNNKDYEKFINEMKENINKKILCEYEGGN